MYHYDDSKTIWRDLQGVYGTTNHQHLVGHFNTFIKILRLITCYYNRNNKSHGNEWKFRAKHVQQLLMNTIEIIWLQLRADCKFLRLSSNYIHKTKWLKFVIKLTSRKRYLMFFLYEQKSLYTCDITEHIHKQYLHYVLWRCKQMHSLGSNSWLFDKNDIQGSGN